MTDLTLFVGLDVHKKTISVAMVEATAGAEVRFYGTIANTPDAIRGLCKKLTKDGQQLHFCYEAGPCGYGVQRQLSRLGHRCDVVAPALIPRKVGDKVKTDRRDAMMLAQTLRAGQLTAVWVPDEAHEAMRDLVRLRAQAMRDLRKTRQQLLSFLLRHSLVSPYGHWTKMHRRWLGELIFAHPAQHLAHEEMLQRIERAEALCDRLNGLPEPIRNVAWKAQVRLSARYRKLIAAGKPAPKVVVAIARELVGFIWAIARMVEPKFA